MASISSAWTFVWACAKRSHSSSTIDYKRLSKLIWIRAGTSTRIASMIRFHLLSWRRSNCLLRIRNFHANHFRLFFLPFPFRFALSVFDRFSSYFSFSLLWHCVCTFPLSCFFLADTKTHSNHSAIPPHQLRYHTDVYIHTRSNALHTFLPSSWAAVESDFKLGRVEKKNPGMNNPGLKKKGKVIGWESQPTWAGYCAFTSVRMLCTMDAGKPGTITYRKQREQGSKEDEKERKVFFLFF